MILKNTRGLHGQKTTAVIIPTKAAFHLLHQEKLTNGEMELFILFNKICNTNGVIRNLSKGYVHHLYNTYTTYFEEPMVVSSFYSSFQKLHATGLFHMESCEITGLTHIKLNYFKEDDVMGRYTPIHPIVFTTTFKKLSVAAKKLFLLTAVQQGNNPFIFRKMDNLYNLLNKTLPHHVRATFDELTTKRNDKAPFFSFVKYEKTYQGYGRVYFSIHEDYVVKEKGDYHDGMDVKTKYPRKATFISNLLHQFGLGELESELAIFIHSLKHQGYRVIRHALAEIKEFVERNGHFPKELAYFLKKVTRIKREGEILDLARTTGLEKYIAPKEVGEERKNKMFDFVVKYAGYSNQQLQSWFTKATKQIESTVAAYKPTLADYTHNTSLRDVYEMVAVRTVAMKNCTDKDAYYQLEQEACAWYDLYQDARFVCDWMLERMKGGEAWREVDVEETMASLV